MTKFKIVKNEVYGDFRLIVSGKRNWLIGEEVARAAGYDDPRQAVSEYVPPAEKTATEIKAKDGTPLEIITCIGAYELCRHSQMSDGALHCFIEWIESILGQSVEKPPMSYARREQIFSKEVITLSEMQELLSCSPSAASVFISRVKRQAGDRLKIEGRLHIQDYLNWLSLQNDACVERYIRFEDKEAARLLCEKKGAVGKQARSKPVWASDIRR